MDAETLRPIIVGAPIRTFWLKRVGISSLPLPQSTQYRLNRVKIDFAKKPGRLAVGAIVIAYRSDDHKLLYVAEGYTPARQATGIERAQEHWPTYGRWTMWGVNLTPQYGTCWSHHDLQLEQMYARFQELHPDSSDLIDMTLQGQAEQRISPAFGAYLMQQIVGLPDMVIA